MQKEHGKCWLSCPPCHTVWLWAGKQRKNPGPCRCSYASTKRIDVRKGTTAPGRKSQANVHEDPSRESTLHNTYLYKQMVEACAQGTTVGEGYGAPAASASRGGPRAG